MLKIASIDQSTYLILSLAATIQNLAYYLSTFEREYTLKFLDSTCLERKPK